MKLYKVYLFDFDYTLADSSRGIVMCFRNVLERHQHTGITDDEIKRTIGKTLQESFSILTGITDADTLEAYKKEYVKEADVHMTVNTFLFPETEEVLTRLKTRGAKIGIISTKYRYRIMELLSKKLPSNFLDIIVGGEDVKEPKPSPEGVLLAIKELGCNKEEVLYIGDSIVDAETAQSAQVDFAGVLHGATTREELSAYRDVKCYSFLVKPFSEEEFVTAFRDALGLSKQMSQQAKTIQIEQKQFILEYVTQDIAYIEAFGKKLVIHTISRLSGIKEDTISGYTLSGLLALLDDPAFVQCHKSYVVNKSHIEKIDKSERKIFLKGFTDTIPIGNKYQAELWG